MGGRAGEAGRPNDGGMRARPVLDRVEDRDRPVEHADVRAEDLAGPGPV